MQPASISRARPWAVVLALLVPTACLLPAELRMPIDVANRAMKSVGTDEAEALARRTQRFGRDDTVVLEFERRADDGAGDAALAADAARIDEQLADVARLPGVAAVEPWPGSAPDRRVVLVRLDVAGGDCAALTDEIVRRARCAAPQSVRVAVSGQPAAEVVIAREVQRERERIAPCIALGLTALLLLYYRHLGLVIAILVPAAVAIVWTSGIAALLGRELDPISVMLQPVLLTVGVASGVHWIEAYLDERTAGHTATDAIRRAARELRVPAMLAGVTTVVGFLSLACNTIPAVIDFGVFAALGVGLTYWIASFATPALLAIGAARVPARLLARRGATAGRFGVLAADWIAAHARSVRVASAVVAVAALAAWVRIDVDSDPLRLLPSDHEFVRDTASVARAIGGSETFDVLVPGGSRAASPVQLALLAGACAQLDGVAGPAGPLLRAESGDWLLRFVLEPSGSAVRERLFDAVEERARALGAGDVRVTGTSVQIARDSGRLVRGSLTGLGASAAVLFAVFWTGFRSLRYAWLAMVPNVLPCLIVYGGLACIGRPLSVATAMISSVLLGLIVDDTIHLLYRYRGLRASGEAALASIERVFAHSGRAVAITSVVLCAGFSLTMFGRLTTTVEFGALAAVTIVVAALCDLLILPAILVAPAEAARA